MKRSILIFAAVLPLHAGEVEVSSADKSGYHLFNPTPRELMREMSTDRPDITESPITVDAGHVQIEMDMAAFTSDRHTPERDGGSEGWSFANTNIKLGLTNWADLQFVVPIYNRVRGGADGFGDMQVRLKMNVWGNDGGATAFGLMPWIKLPTASDGLGNDDVEGGLIVPFGADLGNDWSFGAMLEVDAIADGGGGGYHAEFVNSLTVGHPIVGELGGYLEFVSVLSTERGADWVALAAVGFTYGISADVQLDAGVNFGLTRAAEDLSPFVGLSIRF